MKNTNKKRGFTLIELVVVVAIIAILSAVLIPTFAGIINKANQSADVTNVRNMNTVLSTAVVVDDIFDVSAALDEAGFSSKDGLYASAKGYAYYWHKTTNQIVYVKTSDNSLVFPEKVDNFNFANCQALGTSIPTRVVEPSTSATANSTVSAVTGVLPADKTTFTDVVAYLNGATLSQKVESTLSTGAKKTGILITGDLTLNEDISLTKRNKDNQNIVINIEGNVTIDLNGHTLALGGAAGQSYASIAVRNGATLSIVDSSAAQTGKLLTTATGFQVDAGATLNVYGGTIAIGGERSADDIKYGSLIVWVNGGTFNMFGGVLNADTGVANSDDWAISADDGVANLFGGEITGTVGGYYNAYDVVLK